MNGLCKHRDTETQRHRNTETQKHRNTETQKHRDTEGFRGIPAESLLLFYLSVQITEMDWDYRQILKNQGSYRYEPWRFPNWSFGVTNLPRRTFHHHTFLQSLVKKNPRFLPNPAGLASPDGYSCKPSVLRPNQNQ